MSTTLIPPTFCVVKPRGRPVRVYLTLADAAGAIVFLGTTPATVGALTGRRSRRLTDGERRELGHRIRASGWGGRRDGGPHAVDE